MAATVISVQAVNNRGEQTVLAAILAIGPGFDRRRCRALYLSLILKPDDDCAKRVGIQASYATHAFAYMLKHMLLRSQMMYAAWRAGRVARLGIPSIVISPKWAIRYSQGLRSSHH